MQMFQIYSLCLLLYITYSVHHFRLYITYSVHHFSYLLVYMYRQTDQCWACHIYTWITIHMTVCYSFGFGLGVSFYNISHITSFQQYFSYITSFQKYFNYTTSFQQYFSYITSFQQYFNYITSFQLHNVISEVVQLQNVISAAFQLHNVISAVFQLRNVISEVFQLHNVISAGFQFYNVGHFSYIVFLEFLSCQHQVSSCTNTWIHVFAYMYNIHTSMQLSHPLSECDITR